MKFILDENFPKAAELLLKQHGHEAFDLHKLALNGKSDTEILKWAMCEKAIVLTTDRDFFHTLQFTYPNHSGMVIIALRQPSRQHILTKLEWFLNHVPQKHWPMRAFQLRDATWMASPPIAG